MEKIYENGNDLHVRAYVVYGKSGKLYADKDGKKTVTLRELTDAFLKGALLVMDGETQLKPVSCGANGVTTVGAETKTWTASAEDPT